MTALLARLSLLVRGDESRSSLPPPPTPALLDYQSAQTDQGSRTRSRAVTFWSIGLIVSWAPFVCGVVNALVAAQKYYSPAIVKSHFPASIGFMTMGAIISALCLVGFIRLRHTIGALAAAVVLAAQLALAVCLGLTG